MFAINDTQINTKWMRADSVPITFVHGYLLLLKFTVAIPKQICPVYKCLIFIY